MKVELMDKDGIVVGIANLLSSEDPVDHYPFYLGAVSWREVDPAVIAAEEAAKAAAKQESDAIIANLKAIIFDLESRLRVLEKKPPISIAEYKPVK